MVDKARVLDKYKVCQLHLSLIGHFPRVIYRDFLFTYPFFSISVYLLLFFCEVLLVFLLLQYQMLHQLMSQEKM